MCRATRLRCAWWLWGHRGSGLCSVAGTRLAFGTLGAPTRAWLGRMLLPTLPQLKLQTSKWGPWPSPPPRTGTTPVLQLDPKVCVTYGDSRVPAEPPSVHPRVWPSPHVGRRGPRDTAAVAVPEPQGGRSPHAGCMDVGGRLRGVALDTRPSARRAGRRPGSEGPSARDPGAHCSPLGPLLQAEPPHCPACGLGFSACSSGLGRLGGLGHLGSCTHGPPHRRTLTRVHTLQFGGAPPPSVHRSRSLAC